MNLVIFSSVFSIVLLVAIVLLYVAYGVLAKLKGEQKTILNLLGIANFVLHIGFFVVSVLVTMAPIEELLFVLVFSLAVAITVTKRGKEEQ